MLETIREYAAERLESSGETDIVGERHAGFFIELVENALPTLHGPDEANTKETVAQEAANAVAAIEWARERDEPEQLLRLSLGGEVLLLPPREQVIWLEEALERSEALSPVLVAHGYRSAGGVRFILNDLEEAKSLLLKAASLYRELNDPEGEALTLRILGGVLSETGKAEEGRICLRRALALSERSGGAHNYAILHHLGELEREHGDPKEAAEHLIRSIELARGQGDLGAVANALHGLGDLLLSQRNPDDAEDRYRESLTLNAELKSSRGCNFCLRGLAAAAALQGQTQRAGQLWGAASAAERESGYGISARSYAQYERAVASCKGHEFDAAVTAGRQMTLDDAVAYALEPPSTQDSGLSTPPAP
jgi:tetratricopeptide (TPR) repeat protein